MIHLAFQVPGEAVGKKEQAKIGHKLDKHGRRYAYPYIYTEPKTRAFMASVTAHAQLAVLESNLADLPTDDALAIEIVSFFPRPKSAPLSRKWPIARGTVPDASNIQKGVEDALHGVVFVNDCQVVSIKTDKRYCTKGMEPHTRVEIWTAGAKRYADIRSMRPGG